MKLFSFPGCEDQGQLVHSGLHARLHLTLTPGSFLSLSHDPSPKQHIGEYKAEGAYPAGCRGPGSASQDPGQEV